MTDADTAANDDLGEPSRPSADGQPDTAFHTDTPAASGARQRGLGVGAAELAAQGDPNGNPLSPGNDLPVRDPDEADSAADSNRRA